MPLQLPQLPFEAIDEIICHLDASKDYNTLLQCSLVSHSFLVPSRHCLFSQLALKPTELCSFLRLLDVPWNSIAPSVSRITIQGSTASPCRYHRPRLHGFRDGPTIQSPYYTPMDSNRLIYHLRRVHSIRFSSVSLSLIAPPFWKLLHDLKGVKELEVHHMTFRSPHDFFGFVNELPELESLTIVRPTWQGKGEWDLKRQEPQRARVLTRGGSRESGSSRRGLCIPVFDLGRMCQREILDWLMAQNPIPAIHTFRLDLANTNVRGGDITKFLEVAGSTIQHIQVRLSGDFSGNVDFASCTNLKSIRVDGLTIGDLCRPTYLRASEQFLRRTLENLPSSRLEQIVLSYTMTTHDAALFGIPDTSLLQMYNWELVADILRNRHQDKKSCELDIQGHHSGAHHTYTQSPDHDHKCSKMELKIEISQFPQYLQASAKEYMTKGPFADWCQNGNEGDLVNIDFMPVRDFILPLPFRCRRSGFRTHLPF